ncbi:two-component system regulatory protein YycI [Saccharibacillus sp. CPCC 101409]|uniref:two-component system regulatory protein YycI n=1 Tax=Saccharibacillus sp. CPCC 101409 TaxID=3058041 RepID=UPI002673D124|nr:two-component system regulatory protein YycI [Saccharibacillus sp. CPCC 101409]MDO3409687.1 two-component system regulatory protein YycI [Saccharibacillus sp. CPCC 101409]
MDWGRAKNVLIYAFLLLNLVLGYQLWTDAREQQGVSLGFDSLSESTQRAMEDKNIQVLTSVPGDTPSLPKISYRYAGAAPEEPVPLKASADSKLIFAPGDLASALKAEIPNIGDYSYDAFGGGDGSFTLHPLFEQRWPLFNVNLELFYTDQKITAYRGAPVVIEDAGGGAEVLPAQKALGTLIENYLPEGSVVKDIALGFYGQTFDSETQVAAPVWRFTIESEAAYSVYYVQGASGDVISP